MDSFSLKTDEGTLSLKEIHDNIIAAANCIKEEGSGIVLNPPLIYSYGLSSLGSNTYVHIKLESEQLTGSFKIRGAFNKIKHMSKDEKQKGFVTSSSGNHGIACAYLMKSFGIPGTIYVPNNVSDAKKKVLEHMGANLVFHGNDCYESELKGRAESEKMEVPYMSPYNDLHVLGGNGTPGVEILRDLPSVDYVLVPVGGGGLISGIACYMKYAKPTAKIIGCQPKNSKVMYECVREGRIISDKEEETLSEATAGGIEENSVTYDICNQLVDDWILVEEEDIAKGIYFMMENHKKIVEGSAGMVIGAYMANAEKFKDSTVVIISCGCNITMDKIKQVIKMCEH